jgi:ribonucleoside-triphosphate reductase (thioredoxin)
MNKTQEVLSDIVIYNKYAKYISNLKRRETWSDIVYRYLNMMVDKYPILNKEIWENGQFLLDKKVLMSMRAAQFSGAAVEKNNTRVYNCSYLPLDHYLGFSELMFLLLGGTGVGYSVQQHHIEKLPDIHKPIKNKKYLIGDSIEGWSDAIKALMKSYFGLSNSKPVFDFSDIREKGARLVTAGGKAPGPEPLKKCLFEIELILERKQNGEKLSDLEVHDICCHIADAVLAGGIRRAALISLFSADSQEMRTCKFGNWWELNPQRGRANNSVVLLRHKITKRYFLDLWKQIEESNSGEPGFFFSNDKEWGTNPCAEVSLRPFTFCNLTEINAGDLESEEDFFKRCEIASFFGTLQAGITDFHYLRDIWIKNTKKDALIGVGITGIANGNILELYKKNSELLKQGVEVVKNTNEKIANIIGINKAARTTTIKPSGTTSCVLGTSSGIHAWHSQYYIRNMQCSVGDDLYNYFKEHHPKLIKVMDYMPKSAVIGVPQKAPDIAILRENETALDLLERVKLFNLEWVREGHRSGENTNNVSATISLKKEDWLEVGNWIWNNKNCFNGLSVLPFDGGTYVDAPFTDCTKEEYEKKLKYLTNIDLTKIIEENDNTTLSQELACAGDGCIIT